MTKKKLSPQKKADRALCPVQTANVMQMKAHEIARWMREVGVTEPLIPQNAKKWKTDPSAAPEWFTSLPAEKAARDAEREHRERRDDIEYQHHQMILWDKVDRRLLAGAKHFRNPDAELIAWDMAFRAGKELCRAHTDTCGEITPELLTDLDVAALRWAGIDPFDHSTWVVHRGDRPG
jgi:hypothetical protein